MGFKNMMVVYLGPIKKGGDNMAPEMPKEIEVERVMNLVSGFGWDKVKEEVVGEDLVLTIKKRFIKFEETPGGGIPT